MEIGVLGGAGTAGTATVEELRARGHDVRVLSRRSGFDVTDPDASALDGLEALVDCLNPTKTSTSAARAVLVAGLGSTLALAAEHGVNHVASLSIVGIDELPLGYYRVKLEQEALVKGGPLPGTVVRATQFPELFDLAFGATKRLGVILTARGPVTPVAPRDVAKVLADVVEEGPGGEPVRQVRGPEIVDLRRVAEDWKRATGSRRKVVTLPAIGAALKVIARGDLVDESIPATAHGWSELIGDATDARPTAKR